MQSPGRRHQLQLRVCVKLGLIILAAFFLTPSALAQVPDDAKRVSLEKKIAALVSLVCRLPTPPDPQVTTLKGVLDSYAQQYGATLDAQIKALSAHQVTGLSDDDQDVMASARSAKR